MFNMTSLAILLYILPTAREIVMGLTQIGKTVRIMLKIIIVIYKPKTQITKKIKLFLIITNIQKCY